jgi:hypothetical protein
MEEKSKIGRKEEATRKATEKSRKKIGLEGKERHEIEEEKKRKTIEEEQKRENEEEEE